MRLFQLALTAVALSLSAPSLGLIPDTQEVEVDVSDGDVALCVAVADMVEMERRSENEQVNDLLDSSRPVE